MRETQLHVALGQGADAGAQAGGPGSPARRRPDLHRPKLARELDPLLDPGRRRARSGPLRRGRDGGPPHLAGEGKVGKPLLWGLSESCEVHRGPRPDGHFRK